MALSPASRHSRSSSRQFSAARGELISITASTKNALRIASRLRSIPILSIVSDDSLMPAVSMKRSSAPSIILASSIVSRVVPGMSDTIALSSHRRAFNRVLFPLFGAPAIATGIPFLMALPSLKLEATVSQRLRASSSRAASRSRLANSTSSSLKSNSSSSRAESSTRLARIRRSSWE